MTTTSTAPATAARDYAAEYVEARLAVLTAADLGARWLAEHTASKIVEAADAEGVDLYPVLFDLEAQAMRRSYELRTDAELRDLLAVPYARRLAREVLTARGTL